MASLRVVKHLDVVEDIGLWLDRELGRFGDGFALVSKFGRSFRPQRCHDNYPDGSCWKPGRERAGSLVIHAQ